MKYHMIQNLKHLVRSYTGLHPDLFFRLYGVKSKNKKLFVNKKSELVIEGFPRSGNTFAVVAFQSAQKRNVKIAHHLHVPAQIIRAVNMNIPALVLIRNPSDSIASLMVRHPHVAPHLAIKDFCRFYSVLLPARDRFGHR